MKITCPGCQKEYEIVERRIPPKGLRMRCTGCQTTIAIPAPGEAAGPTPGAGVTVPPPIGASVPPAAPRGRSMVPTLQGIAPPIPGPGTGPAPGAGMDLFGDLSAPAPAMGDPFANLPSPATGTRDPFADLPAPKAAAGDPFADLPAPKPPVRKPFADLPAPAWARDPFADLPVPAAARDPFSELPAPKPAADPFADLPGPRVGPVVDLPARTNDPFSGLDLPAPHAPSAAGLPAPAGDPFADLDLPAARGAARGPGPSEPGGIPIPPERGTPDPLRLASMPPPGTAPRPPIATPRPPAPARAVPPTIAPAPPKLGPMPGEAAPPPPDLEPSVSEPEGARKVPDRKGGTAFGELDLGEPDEVAHETAAARPEGYRGESEAVGGELDLDMVRPSRPSAVPRDLRLREPPAAARPAERKGSAVPLLVVLLLLGGGAAAVPYLLGYGPFGIEFFAGGGGQAGEGPVSSGVVEPGEGDVVPDTVEAIAVEGIATDERLWGDLPRVDERFLARPDVLVEGMKFQDYVHSGNALLKLQDPLYMTTERWQRLRAIPAFNALVPEQPGRRLLRLRQLAGAAFDRAREIAARHVDALAGMGRVHLLNGDVAKAVAAFDQAVGIAPDDPELLLLQARATLAERTADRFQRVERTLAQLDGLIPDDPRVLVLWGDVFLGYEAFRKAEMRYRTALDVLAAAPPGEAAATQDAGDSTPQTAGAVETAVPPGTAATDAGVGEETQAATVDEEVLRTAYQRAVAFYVMIASKKRAGEISIHSMEFREEPQAYLAEATRLRDEGRPRLSIPMPLDATYGVAIAKYALSHADADLLARAKSVLEEVQVAARSFLVTPLEPMYYLGLIYYRDRQILEARAVFESIQAQDDTYPGVFMMLVQLSYAPKMLRDQLPENLAKLEADPTDPERLLRVAVSAYYAGQTDLAVEKLRAILAQNADAPDANHYLGRIYLEGGRLEDARAHLERAVERTATPVASYYLYLGWLCEKEGRYNEAIGHLQLAKDLDDRAWEAFWRLGEIFAQLRIENPTDREYGTAEKLLLRAAELNPKSASVQASLGRLYDDAGNSEAAIERYRQALSLTLEVEELGQAELAAINTALGRLLTDVDVDGALASFRQALRIGIALEDAARRTERPDYRLPARWYWEAAYRMAGLFRAREDLPRAAAYYQWVLPYVSGHPEEATVRRQLGVILQVVPASQIPTPEEMRTMANLP